MRFSGVMCRNQRPASSPAWHYSWRRSYESLPQMQLIDRDLVFTDVAIRAADMPLTPGEHARAILAAVEEHLALNPNDWFVRYDRAIALIRLGEFQKALAEFDAVISKAPRESVTGYQFLRAVVHARLGHKKECWTTWPRFREVASQRASSFIHRPWLPPNWGKGNATRSIN